jgi:hypothetical protein
MNRLDLKGQIELQARILDTLGRAVGEGRMEIAELERQNHQRQDSVDATLVQEVPADIDGGVENLSPPSSPIGSGSQQHLQTDVREESASHGLFSWRVTF